jgi:hypothetical protein
MRLGAALVAAAVAGSARADLGPCDKLLEQGIRSYVSAAARKDFPRAAYPSLCSAFEKASKDPAHASARAAWEAVGGERERDRLELGRLKTAYCTLGKPFAAHVPLYRKTAAALSPGSVKAWQLCTDAAKGKYGPAMEVEQIDDYALSFTLRPTASELRSVQVTVEGFDKCAGFVQGAEPRGGPARFDVPVLAKGREHDLACFRKLARKPPCGAEAAVPASLALEFEDGSGRRFTHRFEMGRVMSWECPPPGAP